MFVFIQLIFISISAFSKSPVLVNCKEQLETLSKEWGGNLNWLDKQNGLFISSTDDFGKWIWLKDEGDSVTLTRATQYEQLRVNFQKNNCDRKMMIIPTITNNKNAEGIGGDEFLKKNITAKNGLIYLWSPQMPLSYRGIAAIEKVALKYNLDLNIYLDSGARLPKKHNFNTKYLHKIDSFELKMRNAYMHMPSLLAYKNGTMIEKVKYGYETIEGYEYDIKNVFNF
jgi:hypothetical protein